MTKNKKTSIDLLLNAAPKNSQTITINEISIDIQPLSLMTISKLLRRFPQAVKMLFGENESIENILINCGAELIAALIAAGTGHLNDMEQEQKIQQLPDEWQMEIVSEIIALTMPDGVEDFIEKKLVPFISKTGMMTADS